MDAVMARKMHRTLEAYHGMIYLVPEATAAYQELGVSRDRYHVGYFASRAAAMGPVPGEVVVATFYNFHPSLVMSAVPGCWDLAPPDDWQRARRQAADAALHRLIGDAIDGSSIAEALQLARAAADACGPAGRPLFAGHASLDWPDRAHLALWHAITLLREYRGDGHVAALTEADVSPIEALLLHEGMGAIPPGVLQTTRSWSDDEWEAGRAQLRERGWMDGDELSTSGRRLREDLEARTDELAMAPWRVLGSDGCQRLRQLVRPLSKAIVDSGDLGPLTAARTR
jgi:hypothetical protein